MYIYDSKAIKEAWLSEEIKIGLPLVFSDSSNQFLDIVLLKNVII